MKITGERAYDSLKIPFNEDLTRFAPKYFPETYTIEERTYMAPFFSNFDGPVYTIQFLPEEVIGALSSRYSRWTGSLRRVYLDEYVKPVIYPERQKSWDKLTQDERHKKLETKGKFQNFVTFWNAQGGFAGIANDQRAENFYDKWLALYGDDSIEEMGNVHVCFEGMSNAVAEKIVDQRIGLSFLAKSSRYVPYDDLLPDGSYLFEIPGGVRGTKSEKEVEKYLTSLFKYYSENKDKYLEYIMKLLPKGDDETEESFEKSRSAKRWDDIRDLLPFATKQNLAVNANGRAAETAINRLLADRLGEARWWGQQGAIELEKAIASFVKRPKQQRGAELQFYRRNLEILRDEMADEIFSGDVSSEYIPARNVRLISKTPDADVEVLSGFLFGSQKRLSLEVIRGRLLGMTKAGRNAYLKRILEERKFGRNETIRERDRHKKVPRAFENAKYTFEIWARGGDYRDLHRHRVSTHERQPFTTEWGFGLEDELLDSPFATDIRKLIVRGHEVRKRVEEISPLEAEYPVPFAYFQHWYCSITARQIHTMAELRTGPQGRRHYRQICQEIGRIVSAEDPGLFQSLQIDNNDYALSRRESEKKAVSCRV